MEKKVRTVLLTITHGQVTNTELVTELSGDRGTVPFTEGLSLMFHSHGIGLVAWDSAFQFNVAGYWESVKDIFSGMEVYFPKMDIIIRILGLVELPLTEIL